MPSPRIILPRSHYDNTLPNLNVNNNLDVKSLNENHVTASDYLLVVRTHVLSEPR